MVQKKQVPVPGTFRDFFDENPMVVGYPCGKGKDDAPSIVISRRKGRDVTPRDIINALKGKDLPKRYGNVHPTQYPNNARV